MNAAEKIIEQPYYPDQIIEANCGDERLIAEVYTGSEVDLILWLLERAPLGVRVWLSNDNCGLSLVLTKADVRRQVKELVRISPRMSLQYGTLYIDTQVQR